MQATNMVGSIVWNATLSLVTEQDLFFYFLKSLLIQICA